jgi:hypothetical protein
MIKMSKGNSQIVNRKWVRRILERLKRFDSEKWLSRKIHSNSDSCFLKSLMEKEGLRIFRNENLVFEKRKIF